MRSRTYAALTRRKTPLSMAAVCALCSRKMQLKPASAELQVCAQCRAKPARCVQCLAEHSRNSPWCSPDCRRAFDRRRKTVRVVR